MPSLQWDQPIPNQASARVGSVARVHYKRRRPEHTVLYRLVRGEFETSQAQVHYPTRSPKRANKVGMTRYAACWRSRLYRLIVAVFVT